MATPVRPVVDVRALERGLLNAGLDHSFHAFECVFVGRFSNDVWRLDLDNGVRLIVKIPYGTPRPGENSEVERLFYEWAKNPSLPIPRHICDLNGGLVLAYHDLHSFSFREGVDDSHADAAIDALADWHAAFWKRPPDVPWLPNLANLDVRQTIQNDYDLGWAEHRDLLLEYVPEFQAIGDALVGRLCSTLAPMAEPATLIHGDAHAENVPLTEDGALLLDWQDPRIANPGLDLAVFTTMSFREDQRASREQNLVDRHMSRVRSQGCDWPDPWQDYRLGLLRRAARIVEIAGTGFESLPWVFRRSAVGAVDHNVGELIR